MKISRENWDFVAYRHVNNGIRDLNATGVEYESLSEGRLGEIVLLQRNRPHMEKYRSRFRKRSQAQEKLQSKTTIKATKLINPFTLTIETFHWFTFVASSVDRNSRNAKFLSLFTWQAITGSPFSWGDERWNGNCRIHLSRLYHNTMDLMAHIHIESQRWSLMTSPLT